MGWKYEVLAWTEYAPDKYHYVMMYAGNSFIQFIRAAWEAKRTSGCVKMYWRE